MAKLNLPECPPNQRAPVSAWREPVSIATYGLPDPARHPMFLERRVYQGSSGKVYPLPFYDRVDEKPHDQSWDALHLENEYLRLMILPRIGGRIHVAIDKTNGYDFIYRQNVIKPALVGLAGPWISGGIEFNWPQHHRPSTYMPCDVHIEAHPDGSKTIWLSEHEPMNRMKGMHGVCLHPEKSYIELKVRLYNRTELKQTFLWWANAATRAHEQYQSFFPSDVHCVADHAKRAMSRFPLCDDRYYGVDYSQRGRRGVPSAEAPRQFVPPAGMYPPNDLSWYANIPVPTSYMCMGTNEDFFGGYDHAVDAGIVHFANHHISPGKKQWTWGNHDFGYAWDRNLTDPDDDGIYHPYIELMAGVFTDNQPDFSFLSPGETRTFSQYWYPIRMIGPAAKANLNGAVSLKVQDGKIDIGIAVTTRRPDAEIVVLYRGEAIGRWNADISPASPWLQTFSADPDLQPVDLEIKLRDQSGEELISYRPQRDRIGELPPPANPIPAPEAIKSSDELYLSGLHLEQYRHATRRPEHYWREALRRDPLDWRCNHALGLWHLRRGEFALAESCFRKAIQRLTHRNPNPESGEPFYHLGIALRHLDRDGDAYGAFYKATWSAACRAAAFFKLAQIDCTRGDWPSALEHVDRTLRVDVDHLQARNLKALILQKLGQDESATKLLRETLLLDPLDWSARHLLGQTLTCDSQVRLDLALDYSAAGFAAIALQVLQDVASEPLSGTAPLVHYYRANLFEKLNLPDQAVNERRLAATAAPDYCFPARLQEIEILQRAASQNACDARAPYYLGNLLYDRQRYDEAIAAWEESIWRDSTFATAWRNLGIAYFNHRNDSQAASQAYDKACAAAPGDARLLYERDQLCKRLRVNPRLRLAELERHLSLVRSRDDLTLELCTLYNQTGRHDRALELLTTRRFQPWEGGEGLALAQYVRTQLALGRQALKLDKPLRARKNFEAALRPPDTLGEANHLLANQSHIHYWLGVAADAAGDSATAKRHWTLAANASGDFREMSVRPFSEMTCYSALALQRLGCESASDQLLSGLIDYANSLMSKPAEVDYFATSLPTMLLFNEDLNLRQTLHAKLLKGLAFLANGTALDGMQLLAEVLELDPSNEMASDCRFG